MTVSCLAEVKREVIEVDLSLNLEVDCMRGALQRGRNGEGVVFTQQTMINEVLLGSNQIQIKQSVQETTLSL